MKKNLQRSFCFFSLWYACLAFSAIHYEPIDLERAQAHLESIIKTNSVLDDYVIKNESKLGNGASSQVYLGHSKLGTELVAIRETNITSNKVKKRELKGLAILMQLQGHPHIVEVKDIYLSKNKLYVVMEYLVGGDLCDSIENTSKIPDTPNFSKKQFKRISREVLETLRYLHQRNVVYRDLKPENILFKDKCHTKISFVDFGFATIKDQKCVSFCGTEGFLARESLLGTPYDEKVDIWSFGCFLFVCATSEYPFPSEFTTPSDEESKSCSLMRKNHYKKMDKNLKKLINSIFKPQTPEARPSADDLLSNLWFKNELDTIEEVEEGE